MVKSKLLTSAPVSREKALELWKLNDDINVSFRLPSHVDEKTTVPILPPSLSVLQGGAPSNDRA